VISRSAIQLLEGFGGSLLGSLVWRFVRSAAAGRKRRLRLLEMELRLAAASEAFHQEVFRLKHYRVLGPAASWRKAALISSTKVSSLRYIRGRENED
jgi:hypothetical protein